MLTSLLRTHLRQYRLRVALIVVLVALQAVANLYLPNLNADIINNGVVKGDVSYIWRTGGVMLGVSVASAIVAVAGMYWASRTSMAVGRDIRESVFEQVQRFSSREMNRIGTASLITRNTNDVQQIQLFLQMALTMFLLAPIMGIGGVIMALREDLTLSWVIVVVVPLLAIVIVLIARTAVPLFRVMQVKIDWINRVLREQITGVRVIRAFVRTEQERRRFDEANADLTATTLRVNRIFVLVMPAILGTINFSSVAVLWFGAHLVDSGSMPIGNLSAFLAYILQILFAVMMGIGVFILVPRAMASGARVQEVLTLKPSIVNAVRPKQPPHEAGAVEFRHVTFGYPGSERPVVHDLSFTVRAGETTAIIGGTGAGKTTLLNLIPRLLDATDGAVLVNGVDVRDQMQEHLWASIGLTPQRAYLFSGTVESNLRFGKSDATEEELWHALAIAQARDFVAAMPGGLEAVITQGGNNVSGGQRQRLAIARAVVRRPRIYLFDDAFSALDAATDARLRIALHDEMRDSTVVIVSQRVSTVMQADTIIVIDAGRILGMGAHAELMATCEPYREIVISQLGAEVAA